MPVSIKHLAELLANKRKAEKMKLFAQWAGNKLFYEATLTQLDHTNRMATVRFSDGVKSDYLCKDLHMQFTDDHAYAEIDEVVSCVCDGDSSPKNNEIVICETCLQGYHQKCHEPKVPNSIVLDVDEDWTCRTCEYMLSQDVKAKKPAVFSSTPKATMGKGKKAPKKPAAKAVEEVSEEVSEEEMSDDNEQPKTPAPVRVRLPAPPKAKAKTGSQEETKKKEKHADQDVNVLAPTNESSPAGQLSEALGKLTTEAQVDIDTAPAVVSDTYNVLVTRKAPLAKTPDIVEALMENKASDESVEEEQPPKIAKALKNTEKTKIGKPMMKKVLAKKPIAGKVPRKEKPSSQKTTPAPA